MARIGRKPIPIPDGVTIDVAGRTVMVTGQLGALNYTHRPEVEVVVEDNRILINAISEDRRVDAFQGLTRSLVNNMVEGVTSGYQKSLEIYGVGYGVNLSGNTLSITCGKSHPEVLTVPAGVEVVIDVPQARGDTDPARFTVKGCDKQVVGEFAAECRRTRPPEPYKGKGVRYKGEVVRRKLGKSFVGGEL